MDWFWIWLCFAVATFGLCVKTEPPEGAGEWIACFVLAVLWPLYLLAVLGLATRGVWVRKRKQ